jgi:hypothetical protein
VVYAASIRSCRPCPLREQCQWNGSATMKPRQVSVLLHPLGVGSAPLLWRDWKRRPHRRACMPLLRQQHVEVQVEQGFPLTPTLSPAPLSRAQRAHDRLTFQERLARPCSRFHSWAGDGQTVRRPSSLCYLARFGNGLTFALEGPTTVPFPRTSPSPSGTLWPLFPDGPPFLSSFALFIGSPPVSLVSSDLNVQFSTIFTHRLSN